MFQLSIPTFNLQVFRLSVFVATTVIFGFFSISVDAQEFRFDVDANDAPASETQSGFIRMTDPDMIGDSINGYFDVSATTGGITVTASQQFQFTDPDLPTFRDRGVTSETIPPQPLQNVYRDFIGSDGNLATIEITISGLPFGTWLLNTFHYDSEVLNDDNVFDILVDDTVGNFTTRVDNATFSFGNEYLGEIFEVRSNGVDDVVIRIVEDSAFDRVRFNGLTIRRNPGILRMDIDADDAPGSGPDNELENSFVRMSEPSMLGDSINGVFTPNAFPEGIFVSATQISGDSTGFRDRGNDPGNLPPYSNLVRDFIFAEGSEGAAIEVAMVNLPAGEFLINSYHYDIFLPPSQFFNIVVDDAEGANQLRVGNAAVELGGSSYLGESFVVTSNGSDDVRFRIVENSIENRTRLNGLQIIPLSDSFVAAGLNFSASTTTIIGEDSIPVFAIDYDGFAELTLAADSSDGGTTEIALYSPNGVLLAAGVNTMSFTDLAAGTYYFAAKNFGGTFADGFDITTSNSQSTARIDVSIETGDMPVSPPENDDWDNTLLINQPLQFSIDWDNFNATTETGEQQLEITDSTVWWFFDAPQDGVATIDTFGSDFDTVLHIYEGFFTGATVADLIPVTNNDQADGTNQSQVSFPIVEGECYEIRVGGFFGAEGNIVLNGVISDFAIGDINCDAAINLLDVAPFVDLIANGGFLDKADINQDGAVNLLDVDPFIALLSGS